MSVTHVLARDVGGPKRRTTETVRRPAESVEAQSAVAVFAPAVASPATAQRQGRISPEPLILGELFDQTAPMLEAPAFFGPPIVFVLGPWLLLILLLIGPFALMFTVLLVLAATIGLLALLMALLVSPYLLLRHLRAATRSVPSRARVHLLFKYPGQLSPRPAHHDRKA